MVAYRISRDGELGRVGTRAMRLYRQEARELVGLLNRVPAKGNEELLADLRPCSYRGRRRAGTSMDDAVESLMAIVITDLRRHGEPDLLEGAIASFLQAERGPWLTEAVDQYLDGRPSDNEIPWYTFAYKARVRWACQRIRLGFKVPENPVLRTDVEGIFRVMDMLVSDAGLFASVFRCRQDMKRHKDATFFDRQRVRLRALDAVAGSSAAGIEQELKALDILEEHSSRIDRYFDDLAAESDSALDLAMRVFDCWVERRLKTHNLTFRLILNGRTSTYALVPSQACNRLDRPDCVELRIIRPRTLLSACLIAYLTLPGLKDRVEEWVEAVGLIDRLAFVDGLGGILRCRACGSWMWALRARRDFCDSRCRYKLWAKTRRGKEKRRMASAAYRRRYSEEVRQATPNVKRGQRNR